MRYLIVLLTILSTFTLFSTDFQLWERQFDVDGGLRNAEFAGVNDEFIVAFDNHHLYKFNTETSELIDSLYYEKYVISSVISNDGLNYYINVEDKILDLDVNTMKVKDTLPTPNLSDNILNKGLTQRTTQINISKDDKLITYTYSESNSDFELSNELVVYDLEQKKIIARAGDIERNYESQFYNPTFTPDAETLLVVIYRPEYNQNEAETQLWFYDIAKGSFINIGDKNEFRNNISGNSEFTFIDDKQVHITRSSLPNLYGLNVLNLENGLITDYFNFKDLKYNIYSGKTIKLDDNTLIISLGSFQYWQTLLVFYDISNNDTLTTFLLDDLGLQFMINKNHTYILGFNNNHLQLYNLSEYLKIAEVKPINIFSDISLTPNPSKDRDFNLTINSISNMNINLNLYNIVGQKVLDIKRNIFINKGENQIEFNIPNELTSGQYFLRIQSERGNQDVKIQF